jgi:carbon monoxide dehydrogenase subunit G
MIFEFGGTPELPSPREAVWRHLQDGDTLAACTPGAESFEVRGPGRYAVRCAVGHGLIRVHVLLEAELQDLVHPESLRLRATGTAPGSTLDVETLVRLEVLGPERTRLEWRSTTGVHGMLARFGRGTVESVLRQFTEAFWNNVAERLAAAPRSGAYRLSAEELLALPPGALAGAILLGPIDGEGGVLPKGHRLTDGEAAALLASARTGVLSAPLRLAWAGSHELHEAEAASLLGAAAAGGGITAGIARQGRVDLVARHSGVLTLSVEGLARVNAIDPLEVFTRWQHQPVEEGDVVGSVKAAPHVLDAQIVMDGVRLAREHAPLVEVRPYAGVSVAAVSAEPLNEGARSRFEAASRLRAESLGGSFLGLWATDHGDPAAAQSAAEAALSELVTRRRVGLLLIGGVSAGDPLSPFLAGLEKLGGVVVRRGVPAHPGSMLWLGRLDATQLLGLPRCGAFGKATAADLLLPRLMTGEVLTAEAVATLGHGGLLGREMRPRFPAYAQGLPEAPAS